MREVRFWRSAKIRPIWAACMFAAMASCVEQSGSSAPPEATQPSPAASRRLVAPESVQTGLVVYRVLELQPVISVIAAPRLRLNGSTLAPCSVGTDIGVELKPGLYTLELQTERSKSLRIVVAEGQVTYVRCGVETLGVGVVIAPPKLVQVDARRWAAEHPERGN
jgi:hypothetical protein